MSYHRLLGSRPTRQTTRASSFYNPQGFDPTEVLPFHLHRYADYARFFLHILYAQRIFKDLREEFVPLKAAYLDGSSPATRSTNRSGKPSWHPRRSSAMGSAIKPIP